MTNEESGEEMGPERLVNLREGIADNTGIRSPILVPIPLAAELLADRDYHHARAETAEAEAAQFLADLADMKRERDRARRLSIENAARHASPGFDNPGWRLVARTLADGLGWSYLYPEETSR